MMMWGLYNERTPQDWKMDPAAFSSVSLHEDHFSLLRIRKKRSVEGWVSGIGCFYFPCTSINTFMVVSRLLSIY